MSKYPAWVTPFLEHLRTSCNVAESCRQVGVASGVAYALRKTDADFAASWEDALEDSYDYLEAEARRRAFEGVEEPVVYQGQLSPIFARNPDGTLETDDDGRPVLVINPDGSPKYLSVRKYSDSLAQFLLKGYRRKKFGEKIELTGKDGGPVAIDETARAARVAQLMALAKNRKDFDDLA